MNLLQAKQSNLIGINQNVSRETILKNSLFLTLFLLIFLLVGCSEDYVSINPSDFNKKIESNKDIKSPEDLIKFYYSYPVNESQPMISVTVEQPGNGNYIITLIADKLPDDSQSTERIIMWATRNGEFWIVNEIRKSLKCYKNRGHQDWGTRPCG